MGRKTVEGSEETVGAVEVYFRYKESLYAFDTNGSCFDYSSLVSPQNEMRSTNARLHDILPPMN
jgi:hypothetical protein